MSKMNSEQIVEVIYALVGDTDAHGESYADMKSRENQKALTEVIDTLVWDVVKNAKYEKRHEYSMKVIGEDARDFLGYLVEEYDLNDYVRKEE